MSQTPQIPLGTSGSQKLEVTEETTLAGMDDRLPALFSTPRMVGLIEHTAAMAIQPYMPEGWISVGVVVNVKHTAPTGLGDTVTAEVNVTAVDERTGTLAFEVRDQSEKIGEGIHVRAPVEVARLLKRVNAKIGG